jgi:uncharacterized RDD family membrane protein YckC
MTKQSQTSNKPLSVSLAPFWKKLAAWVYDLLASLAVFILALLIGKLISYVVTLPWSLSSETVSNFLSHNPLWFIYLAASVQYYYVWCWVKGGQTVGMRTWRLMLCKPNGDFLSWKEAYIRSFFSLGGLSHIWGLIDADNRGLHDLLPNSRVILLPKDHNKQTKPLI